MSVDSGHTLKVYLVVADGFIIRCALVSVDASGALQDEL